MAGKNFFARKNIVISVERYLIDALGAMALGLFASLIVGLILKTTGEQAARALGDQPLFLFGLDLHTALAAIAGFLVEAGQVAMSMMGPAIGVAVAYGLKAPPLVLFASAITGLTGAQLGGPAGAFIGAVVGTEL